MSLDNMLDVLVAIKSGKPVEYKRSFSGNEIVFPGEESWHDLDLSIGLDNVQLDFQSWAYRVKKVPRELYVIENVSGSYDIWHGYDIDLAEKYLRAQRLANPTIEYKISKYREVLETEN